jgi:hypothetical protein
MPKAWLFWRSTALYGKHQQQAFQTVQDARGTTLG